MTMDANGEEDGEEKDDGKGEEAKTGDNDPTQPSLLSLLSSLFFSCRPCPLVGGDISTTERRGDGSRPIDTIYLPLPNPLTPIIFPPGGALLPSGTGGNEVEEEEEGGGIGGQQ